jgi:hypothetical protein
MVIGGARGLKTEIGRKRRDTSECIYIHIHTHIHILYYTKVREIKRGRGAI